MISEYGHGDRAEDLHDPINPCRNVGQRRRPIGFEVSGVRDNDQGAQIGTRGEDNGGGISAGGKARQRDVCVDGQRDIVKRIAEQLPQETVQHLVASVQPEPEAKGEPSLCAIPCA